MPVEKKLMTALQKEYGKAKGKAIYFALENKKKSKGKRGKHK